MAKREAFDDYFRWETSDLADLVSAIADWQMRLAKAKAQVTRLEVRFGDRPVGYAEIWFRITERQAVKLGYTADEIINLRSRASGRET
jgi:hypothetical protein